VLIESCGVGFIAATPQPTYHLLVHNQNASIPMRRFWNNHINPIWEDHQIRDQTSWKLHLKTSNLGESHVVDTNARPFVSIQSIHFVFPFCPSIVGSIVIPLNKQTWETEATVFSDFSRFLPLRVSSMTYKTNKKIMWEFLNIKFTLRNLIPLSNTSLLDRGLAEFIFPNTTFSDFYDKTCFCCELRLVSDSSLGNIEYLQYNIFGGIGKLTLITPRPLEELN